MKKRKVKDVSKMTYKQVQDELAKNMVKGLIIHIPRLSQPEQEAFAEWQTATPERKDEICRELGEYQAKLILKNIDYEVAQQMERERRAEVKGFAS